MPVSPSHPSSRFRKVLLAATLAAVIGRVYLALFTYGTTDATMWESVAQLIRDSGGRSIYAHSVYYPVFNHPPFMMYVLTGLNQVQDATGIPVHASLRLLDTAADAGTIALTALTVESWCTVFPLEAMVLAVIAPSWMFISGFHANSDALMLFFLLLTVYCIQVRKRISWGMVSFAFATGIKIVPILMLPALLWHLKTWGERLRALLILTVFWLASAAPWLIASPGALARSVLEYGSIPSHWGIGWMLSLAPFHEHLAERVFNSSGRYLMILAVIAATWRLNRGKRPVSLFHQFGILLFLFHLLTPGFGIQYLAWLTPWIVILPSRVVFSHVAASSAFCMGVYSSWSYHANLIVTGTWYGPVSVLGFLTWLTVAGVLAAYWRQLRPGDGMPNREQPAAPADKPALWPASSHGGS